MYLSREKWTVSIEKELVWASLICIKLGCDLVIHKLQLRLKVLM